MREISTFGRDTLERYSFIYRLFLREREEIFKLKWIESEKAGFDIGFDLALAEWVVKRRTKWLQAYRN